MNDIKGRLEKCFALALPDLAEEDIHAATMGRAVGWDSLATVNILSLIEEEFAIQVPDSDLDQLHSFEQTLQYLNSKQDSYT